MHIWQVDFYRRPLQDELGNPLWELLICDSDNSFEFIAFCPQSEAKPDWLVGQFQIAAVGRSLPARVQVFRPPTLSLVELACQTLGIAVEPTRHTLALKRQLQQRAQQYPQQPNYSGQPYHPLLLEQLPPVPLSENLWGEQWRFASLPAGDLQETFSGRMIPILEMSEALLPLRLGLASTTPVPGVVIDGGRQSMRLARWLQQARPFALNFIAGQPDGLILEAGLIDRWVVATFEDAEVKTAAQMFEQRKQQSQGLHFLLVQPDDSGMTYTGFWLVQSDRDRP
ncbi:MAG: Tab2/Atab2 family RNA-binding protein [Scytolyngbya sp. HA4215-MV1]|jgi:hypothetical protein|nr:Tab2/Atab2 family RNA-binding protein [Scytolyngbya sp. HA4215-MV1]